MKMAEKVANEVPEIIARAVDRKTGEYAAYLTRSSSPFVIIFCAM
jgi:hypothetical protein